MKVALLYQIIKKSSRKSAKIVSIFKQMCKLQPYKISFIIIQADSTSGTKSCFTKILFLEDDEEVLERFDSMQPDKHSINAVDFTN